MRCHIRFKLYRQTECPVDSGSNFFRQEADEDERKKYRTECWLERCIYDERICSPDEHVSFLPLSIPIPVDGKYLYPCVIIED